MNNVNLFPHQAAALESTKGLNRVVMKEIKGYCGLYGVDTDGNVYSLLQNNSRRKKIIKPFSVNGYLKVNLYDTNGNRSKKFVHRLVAETFIENPFNLPEVNHKDCNHANNKVNNLEWCTRKENLQHSYEHGLKREGENHGCHKLTEQQIREIRKSQKSQNELARIYHVSQSTICAILKFRIWKKVI